MNHRVAAAAALSVLALGVSACGQTGTPTETPAAPATRAEAPAETAPGGPATTQAESPPAAPAGTPQTAPAPGQASANERNAAALRAIATAESAANGTAYEIDDEDDDQTWEVDVMVGERSVEVKVSADGNTVVSQSDDDDDDADDRARLSRATVPLAQAIEIALREVPGTLDDVELDDEDGRDVWEVKIDTPDNDDVKVYVSITDGAIVKIDR